MNKVFLLFCLCVGGCSRELLQRDFSDIERRYSSRIKISSHNYFIIEDVAVDEYASIMRILACHGFNERMHLPSSEGFVLEVSGHTIFKGLKNIEIEYSICDEGRYPCRNVMLYVKNQKRVIIAQASALGG